MGGGGMLGAFAAIVGKLTERDPASRTGRVVETLWLGAVCTLASVAKLVCVARC